MSANDKPLFRCPHCGAPAQPPDESSEMIFRCNSCHNISLSNFEAPQTHFPTKTEKLPGEVLGNYTILRKIGKGGMGTVYKARHNKTGREVAIKSLTINDAETSAEHTRRFLREARLAAAIRHPNVVQVLGFIQQQGEYHIIQEYVGGGSVKTLLLLNGTLPEQVALEIGLGTAKALAEAAQVRIVHRDIKPDNIMLTEDNTVKLADLGLATQTRETSIFSLAQLNAAALNSLSDSATEHSLTMCNMAMGTPAYMAPEQAVDSRSVDQRADLYSLGATMYHMLCGDPPFSGGTLREVLSMHRHAPIPDPCVKRPDITQRTAKIIMRCLAKQPEDRYQNAEELAEELSQHLANLQDLTGSSGAGKTVHFPPADVLSGAISATPSTHTSQKAGSPRNTSCTSTKSTAASHSTPSAPAAPLPQTSFLRRLRQRIRFSPLGSQENITFLIALLLAACLMFLVYFWADSHARKKAEELPLRPQIEPLKNMEEF